MAFRLIFILAVLWFFGILCVMNLPESILTKTFALNALVVPTMIVAFLVFLFFGCVSAVLKSKTTKRYSSPWKAKQTPFVWHKPEPVEEQADLDCYEAEMKRILAELEPKGK